MNVVRIKIFDEDVDDLICRRNEFDIWMLTTNQFLSIMIVDFHM